MLHRGLEHQSGKPGHMGWRGNAVCIVLLGMVLEVTSCSSHQAISYHVTQSDAPAPMLPLVEEEAASVASSSRWSDADCQTDRCRKHRELLRDLDVEEAVSMIVQEARPSSGIRRRLQRK
jgi:hypothetical protein